MIRIHRDIKSLGLGWYGERTFHLHENGSKGSGLGKKWVQIKRLEAMEMLPSASEMAIGNATSEHETAAAETGT